MSIAEPIAAAVCAHCGLAVPAPRLDEGGAPSFCCEGCRTVYDVLREHGLGRYYALRAAAGGTGRAARPSGRAHAELDHPSFTARACRALPGGRLATELYLEGVHCAACVWLVERLPVMVPGVMDARLDVAHARVSVVWDPRTTALSAAARG